MQQISKRLMNWASIIEPNTMAQAETTATMPFVFPHVALMPDAHLGKGATVGSVIPTMGAIMPAAVGVDIGCGMIAVRTQFTEDEVRARGPLSQLREDIEARIPTSAGKYNTEMTLSAAARARDLLVMSYDDCHFDPATRYAPNWELQLGTLGSGNHFIEISIDEESRVWMFLHSGSRGVGNKIAQYWIRIAQDLMKRWFITLPDPDLAYLVEGTMQFAQYMNELRWAQEFARSNREEMMDRTSAALAAFMGADVIESERINCHHNYTTRENHFGKNVWVSRKGAIDAHEGVMGLIPGSMGTASYVVEGKGNKLALCSSPHGAGRNYSRSAARRTFTHEDLRASMVGIEYRDTDAFIDEIPAAYKDIDQVMADAADLVTVRHTLHQIVNVKGD